MNLWMLQSKIVTLKQPEMTIIDRPGAKYDKGVDVYGIVHPLIWVQIKQLLHSIGIQTPYIYCICKEYIQMYLLII